jgi:DNA polymerase-3 subunit delta'
MNEILPSDQLAGWPHPSHTKSLIGHTAAWKKVENAWESGRMPHCWLITGAKGIGKATFAHKMARLIHGSTQPTLVLKRELDEKGQKLKTVISVDEVRALKKSFEMRASDTEWRVCLIDTLDDMNLNAANALLKLIEEPPRNSVFILLSHKPGKTLATIRSRCRVLPLAEIAQKDIEAFLTQHQIDASIAQTAALFANGAIGQAAQYADPDCYDMIQRVQALLRGLPALDIEKVMDLGDFVSAQTHLMTPLMHCLISLLSSFARSTATQNPPPPELNCQPAWCSKLSPAEAYAWADSAEATKDTFEQALALHLDPQRTILTVFLNLKATAERLNLSLSQPYS